jgi:antitoxin component YwqK of YwqJK toxin-antitoxin module
MTKIAQQRPNTREVITETQHFFLDDEGRRQGAYSEWYTAWKPGRQIKIYTEYLNGLLHGRYLEWYENVQPRIDAFYVHGKKHGAYKEISRDDQLLLHYNYEDGQLHGENRVWIEEGKICLRSFYRHGELIQDARLPTNTNERFLFRMHYGDLPLIVDEPESPYRKKKE